MRAYLNVLSLAGLFILIITLQGVPVRAQQTNEELKKEIEQLRERKKLFEERNALRQELEALEKGQAAPKPPVSDGKRAGAEKVAEQPPTDAAVNTAGEAKKDDEIASAIEGARNLFLTKNNVVVNSVCLQQELEPTSYSIYDKKICTIAKQLVANTRINGDDHIILDRGEFTNDIAVLIAAKFAELPPAEANIDKDVRSFILDVENKRTDKQIGADAKGAGTTSLAVKGGVPQFLSWAMENGGVVGSKSGNTLTFRVNPAGLLDSVTSYEPFVEQAFGSIFRSGDSFARSMRNFTLGFSFDISRGTDPPVFIGSKQQLSAFSVRYNFINQKDPRNPIYRKDWEQFRTDVLGPYTQFAAQLHAKLVCTNCNPTKYKNSDLEKWLVETATKLQALDLAQGKTEVELVELTRQLIVEQLGKLPVDKLKTDPDVVAVVNENGKKLISYSQAKKELRDKIAKGAIVTFEYTNYREVNAPDVSNFRFIAEKGFGNNWNLTANASISFLNKKPAGADVDRIRDFDFAVQLEKHLMDLSFGKPVFSFAGQYQRVPRNIVGPDGSVIAGSSGDIAVGQLKLIIPINGTGIKIPLSVTFANRTELVKESTVRGNFGFTFDLDRLLLGRKLF